MLTLPRAVVCLARLASMGAWLAAAAAAAAADGADGAGWGPTLRAAAAVARLRSDDSGAPVREEADGR